MEQVDLVAQRGGHEAWLNPSGLCKCFGNLGAGSGGGDGISVPGCLTKGSLRDQSWAEGQPGQVWERRVFVSYWNSDYPSGLSRDTSLAWLTEDLFLLGSALK